MTVTKCIHVTRPCVSAFLSLCSYLFPNPCLHGSFPSCLGLWPPVPHCLCPLSLSSCLDLPPVTLSHRGDGLVCPFKLQTLSLTDREKGGLDQAREGNTQGPPRLTSTNWPATPTRLILLRFSHQCPLPLPHNVKERIRAPAKIAENYGSQERPRAQLFFDVFCGCLYLVNSFAFVCQTSCLV